MSVDTSIINKDVNTSKIDKLISPIMNKILINCRKPGGFIGSKMIKEMNDGHLPVHNWGFESIYVKDDDKILDVGCGGGSNVKRFSNLSNTKVYGLDYSKTSVKESIKLNKDKIDIGQVEIIQGDITKTNFNDNTFNIVTGFETNYFWPNLKESFKEIYRILKDDGYLFICNEIQYRDQINPMIQYFCDVMGMKIYSKDQYLEILESIGFSEIKFQSKDTYTYDELRQYVNNGSMFGIKYTFKKLFKKEYLNYLIKETESKNLNDMILKFANGDDFSYMEDDLNKIVELLPHWFSVYAKK